MAVFGAGRDGDKSVENWFGIFFLFFCQALIGEDRVASRELRKAVDATQQRRSKMERFGPTVG